MINRRVDRVLRDSTGEISYLLGSWGAATSADVIAELESGDSRYFIEWGSGEQTDVLVASGSGTRSLCTQTDGAPGDRLDAVPTMGRARSA